jgi:hypothetical protein
MNLCFTIYIFRIRKKRRKEHVIRRVRNCAYLDRCYGGMKYLALLTVSYERRERERAITEYIFKLFSG